MDIDQKPEGQNQVQEEIRFEELTAKLDEVLMLLERGDLPLDQALAAYERGVELVRQGNDLLDRAELRITELSSSVSGNTAADIFTSFLGDDLDDDV